MAKLQLKVASTSQSLNIFIQDSSSTTGAGLTGLVFNSSGLTAYYALPKAAAVSITLATLAAITTAYSSGGFKEVDATNMPGWYRFDLPDAAIASGRFVAVHLKGVTNMAPLPLEIELTGWDNQDAVHGGMSALPNTAATTNASLLTSGTGTDQISVSAGKVILQATQSGVTIPTVTTVTNQLTAAQVATGIWQDTTAGDFTTASSIGKSLYTTGNAPGAASGLALVGSNMGTASSVTGAVGSVTGAVGSVTGNVGGNVTGSVGSIASGGITNASLAADTGFKSIRSNTAQAGAAGTLTLDASASAVDSFYLDTAVVLTGGTGAGQARLISAYVGATKVASVTPNWTTTPDVTSTFAILPLGRVDVGEMVGSVPNALISGRVDSNAQVVGTGAIVSGSFAANAIDSGALATTAANEIRDAVWAQAMTELAAVPGVTDTTLNALTWVFELSRNKVTQTATTQLLRNNADAATIGTSTVSDDGTTFTRGVFT